MELLKMLLKKQTRFDKSNVFLLHLLQTPKWGNSGYDCQIYTSEKLEMFELQLQESTWLKIFSQFVLWRLQKVGPRDCKQNIQEFRLTKRRRKKVRCLWWVLQSRSNMYPMLSKTNTNLKMQKVFFSYFRCVSWVLIDSMQPEVGLQILPLQRNPELR